MPDISIRQRIAVNRFGLGARAGDAPPPDPRRWLLDQFGRYDPLPTAWAVQPTSAAIALQYDEGRLDKRMGAADPAAKQAARMALRQQSRAVYTAAVNARADVALSTPTPFVERLVHFWSNHFAVSVDKGEAMPFAGAFEAEAIRPHVLGRFADMLLAVERHPAMLLFLDQATSVGPDSPFASAVALRNPRRRLGLNENLAREIMELHTLGVRTGYDQADVTEFARALTGWSLDGFGRGGAKPGEATTPGAFRFRPAIHQPGSRTIIGRTYDQPGEAQGQAVLLDLAAAPATARHIATALARHFVADDPPPALVDRLATGFQASGGDLPTMYRTLVESPEPWAPAASKFKTPWEWLVSSLRGVGRQEVGTLQILPMANQLGQPIWRPGSPAGWDDVAASWAAPDALVRRVELAQRLASGVGDRLDPRTLATQLLPGARPALIEAVARAENVPTGIALLLVSPDFQRR